jgi:hypothetical protein
MPAMSVHAANILKHMEPDLGYELSELRGFVPELSMEGLREVMHELWIARQVERFRDSGWRRVRSTSGSQEASRSLLSWGSANSGAPGAAPGQNGTVKPEDLFDHGSFAGFFK